MTEQTKVRRAEASDAKAVAALFNEYRIFYRQSSDLQGAESYIAERRRSSSRKRNRPGV